MAVCQDAKVDLYPKFVLFVSGRQRNAWTNLAKTVCTYKPGEVSTGLVPCVCVCVLFFKYIHDAFVWALQRCNEIEGFSPSNEGKGLYDRTTVMATVIDSEQPVAAYMYFQHSKSNSAVISFPEGDWLHGRESHA